MFTRDLYPHPHPHPHRRPLAASRDPRHLDKLPLTLFSKTILDIRVQHCLRGEGRGWTCVNWKTPQKCKSVPRLLSMIVGP